MSARSSSENFWIIVSALATFYKNHGVLPLPGSLPDMKAQSADYIALQNIYKAKAREDVDKVLSIVQATETDLGRISKSVTKRRC
jgi:amyloid beta precursor protein binding protein 1